MKKPKYYSCAMCNGAMVIDKGMYKCLECVYTNTHHREVSPKITYDKYLKKYGRKKK